MTSLGKMNCLNVHYNVDNTAIIVNVHKCPCCNVAIKGLLKRKRWQKVVDWCQGVPIRNVLIIIFVQAPACAD